GNSWMTCRPRVSLCRTCNCVSNETEYSSSCGDSSPRFLNPRGLAFSRLKTILATASYLGFITNEATETSSTTRRKKPSTVHFLFFKVQNANKSKSACSAGGPAAVERGERERRGAGARSLARRI